MDGDRQRRTETDEELGSLSSLAWICFFHIPMGNISDTVFKFSLINS